MRWSPPASMAVMVANATPDLSRRSRIDHPKSARPARHAGPVNLAIDETPVLVSLRSDWLYGTSVLVRQSGLAKLGRHPAKNRRPLSEERLTVMSTMTRTRSFAPTQPAAPQGEFAIRLSAYRAATKFTAAWKLDESDPDTSESELAQRTDAEDTAHDALIGTPASSTHEVAEKINALYRRWSNDSRDLSAPETRAWVVSWPETGQTCDYRDFGQSLLALYLDVTGLPSSALPPRPASTKVSTAFEELRKAYEAAEAVENAAYRVERETGQTIDNDELCRLQNDRLDALWSVMLEPAPDLDALAWKLARGIDVAHADYTGDSAENPETIARLLSERSWDAGCIPAVAYQDVLRLAGRNGPLTEVKPDAFDPVAFLSDLERRTGATVTLTASGSPSISATDHKGMAGNILTAAQEWTALSPTHKGKLQLHLIGIGSGK